VTAAVADVKDDLAALRTSAGAQLQPQLQAVQDAIGDLESAVAEDDAGAAATAVSGLATSAGTLLASLDHDAQAWVASTPPETTA
jgi:hypothetical protein